MKEQIIKEIDAINSRLPKDYSMEDYRADMVKLKKEYSGYTETNSFSLATFVYLHNTADYKRKTNLFLLLGLITYDPEYVLTEKDQKLFKLNS